MSYLQVVARPIDELVLYGGNSKIHPESQLLLIERSMQEFGWTTPVLVDRDNVVVAGHARVEVAKRLGIKDVPTIKLDSLTPDQVRAYRIADNRLSELGLWDRAALGIELEELQSVDFDLEVTGFDLDFVNALSVDDTAVTKGVEDEPWADDDNPVISPATANQYPSAVIRFQTDSARAFHGMVENDRSFGQAQCVIVGFDLHACKRRTAVQL